MGLAVTNYRGYRLVMHGGGIDGFISQMAWLPRERIGIVVLTNYSGAGDTPVPNFLTYHLYDVVLGLDPVDWVARARKASLRGRTSEDSASAAHEAERKPGDAAEPPAGELRRQLRAPGLRHHLHRAERRPAGDDPRFAPGATPALPLRRLRDGRSPLPGAAPGPDQVPAQCERARWTGSRCRWKRAAGSDFYPREKAERRKADGGGAFVPLLSVRPSSPSLRAQRPRGFP